MDCGGDNFIRRPSDSLSSAHQAVILADKKSEGALTSARRIQNRISQHIHLFENAAVISVPQTSAVLSVIPAPRKNRSLSSTSESKESKMDPEPIYVNASVVSPEASLSKPSESVIARKKPVPKPRKSKAVGTLLSDAPQTPTCSESVEGAAPICETPSFEERFFGKSPIISAIDPDKSAATPERTVHPLLQNADFFSKLNELIGDDRRRSVISPSGLTPQINNLRLSHADACDASVVSQRPLPAIPRETGDLCDESTGEPIYQCIDENTKSESDEEKLEGNTTNSITEKFALLAGSMGPPVSSGLRGKRHRRSGKNFRSLRGLTEGAEALCLQQTRAASFTAADISNPIQSSTPHPPHSASCSSVSLAGSDSGISMGFESQKDDASVRETPIGSLIGSIAAINVRKALQMRSSSINNNTALSKNLGRSIGDKKRRHTLPASALLSTTVFDGENDECDQDQYLEIAVYPSRSLWCQREEVIASGVLDQLTDQEKKLQEAVYEIITTEGSFLRSLNVLIDVFKKAPELSGEPTNINCVVTAKEAKDLFLNIEELRDISHQVLRQFHIRYLEHQEQTGQPTMPDISDVMEDFCITNGKAFVSYCSNQHFQNQTLSQLKAKKNFQDVMKRLETDKSCESLDFRSYLTLPMQRVTKLPLLLNAVVKYLPEDSALLAGYKTAIEAVNKTVKACDEGLRRCANIEELCRIDKNLRFEGSIKRIPIISATRAVVKRGKVDIVQIDNKLLPRKANLQKKSAHLLVLTDLLILAKPKSGTDEPLHVIDYCQRSYVDCLQISQAEKDDLLSHSSIANMFNSPERIFRGLKLILLQNHAQKTAEYFVLTHSESDYMRWMDVLNSSEREEGDHRIYDPCNCPKYEIIAAYEAKENDELSLEIGDTVDVYRKSKDGWFEGRRLSDGYRGWFPDIVAREIVSTNHARARLLKERERLLAEAAKMQTIQRS